MGKNAIRKKIALVNYHGEVFSPFAQRLEADGFEIFWINSRPISSRRILTEGIGKDRICEVLWGKPIVTQEQEAKRILAEFEQPGLPTINSIILMSGVLRYARYKDALLYLSNTAIITKKFLLEQEIGLVSSGRDTALQLLVMLICKKLGIFWGCVTRTKLPIERFGFSPTQQGDEFYRIKEVQKNDYDFAAEWLQRFRSDRRIKPGARPKINSFAYYFKAAKKGFLVSLSHFMHLLRYKSDRKIPGSSFLLHIWILIKEFRNYICYRLFLKFDKPADEPFVLYGLHRQPESSIDVRGAFFDEQLTLIKQISRSLPLTHKLYVKVHFSDVAGQTPHFYKTLKSYPGIKLIDPDVNSRDLIERAAIIITNSGAMGQEGGYLGRPVIVMSKMLWSGLPTVRYCDAPPELPGLIRQLIESPPVADDVKIIQVIAELVANSVACDPNQDYLGKELSENDLDVLSCAYSQLFSFAEKECLRIGR